MQADELLTRADELRAIARRRGLDLNAANLVVHAALMQSLQATPEASEMHRKMIGNPSPNLTGRQSPEN